VTKALDMLNPVSPFAAGQLTPETWVRGGNLVANECAGLAPVLSQIMVRSAAGQDFTFEQGTLLAIQERPGHYQIAGGYALGKYANLLSQVVAHPGIDLRRFAGCEVCQAFFYKPRQRSRTCSTKDEKRCENVLKAREHYKRVKKARELRAQGKTLFQIARALGVSTKKARAYLRKGGEG